MDDARKSGCEIAGKRADGATRRTVTPPCLPDHSLGARKSASRVTQERGGIRVHLQTPTAPTGARQAAILEGDVADSVGQKVRAPIQAASHVAAAADAGSQRHTHE